jgi:hypothetical protein
MIIKIKKPLQLVFILSLVVTGVLYTQSARSMQPIEPYVNCNCKFVEPSGYKQRASGHVEFPCNEESCDDYCFRTLNTKYLYPDGTRLKEARCWHQGKQEIEKEKK